MKYYLSVEQTDLRERRARWKRKKHENTCPTAEYLGTSQRSVDSPGGLIAIVSSTGSVEKKLPIWGVEGLLVQDSRILAACPWAIHSIDRQLSESSVWLTDRRCNYLHSLRMHDRSLLIAATGIDAILEVDLVTKETTWCWWAREHGFHPAEIPPTADPYGHGDARGWKFDTRMHSTHINSVLKLSSEYVLATLFHQGSVVIIHTRTGEVTTLLDGLQRPHSIRCLSSRRFSVANTGAGEVIVFQLSGDLRHEIVSHFEVDTPWLQDAYWIGNQWLLTDGSNSRVLHCDSRGDVFRTDQFDRDWRLFEAIPC